MPLKSRYWSDLSTRDFALLQQSATLPQVVAVLPVAATEQHGPHLPLSVDAVLAQGIIDAALSRLAPDLPVLFLPLQSVGKSNEHAAFPGTLTLSSQAVLQVWCELGASVAATGVRKLLLFNTHGGHVSVMDLVARDLRERHAMLVFGASWFNLPLGDAMQRQFSAQEQRFGIHAGDIETSMMLALRPDLVDMRLAQNFRSASQDRSEQLAVLGNGRSAKMGWQMQDYHPAGAVGNAAAATAEKGRALIDAAAQSLADLLAEISELPLEQALGQARPLG